MNYNYSNTSAQYALIRARESNILVENFSHSQASGSCAGLFGWLAFRTELHKHSLICLLVSDSKVAPCSLSSILPIKTRCFRSDPSILAVYSTVCSEGTSACLHCTSSSHRSRSLKNPSTCIDLVERRIGGNVGMISATHACSAIVPAALSETCILLSATASRRDDN